MIRRCTPVLMLAALVAACSPAQAPDPKDLLAASTAGLRAGNYTYTAVMPGDRVDGVTHLPSRSLSKTSADTRYPGIHDATVIVAGDHHFVRTRVDQT